MGKMIKILVCKAGQKAEVQEMEHSLANMQKLVGGLIECIRIAPGVDLWCNEEGKINGLPLNLRSPQDPVFPNDIIAGDFFLAGHRGAGTTSLSDKNIERFKTIFADAGDANAAVRSILS